MKKILNIVITGGPCGGKTTAMDDLAKLLRSLGYIVYICPEAATYVINNGIKPFGAHRLNGRDFQKIVSKTQKYHEEISRDSANACPNDKVAILYDRGLLDGRAYVGNEVFQEILNEIGITESEILSNYDLVIHMVTAAIGAEKFYTTDNNTARTETPEEAREKDHATMESYSNHPNFYIVNNNGTFDEKRQMVENIIRLYIGEEPVIKKERYLVDIRDIDFELCNNTILEEEIEEFVKKYDNAEDEVYSRSMVNEHSYFTYTKNRFQKDGSKVSTCRTIDKSIYLDELAKIKGNVIHKTRYNFIDGGERYRLDFYDINDGNFCILERDVTNINKKPLPYFIYNATNITNNRNYDDDSIFIDYNIDQIVKKKKQGK